MPFNLKNTTGAERTDDFEAPRTLQTLINPRAGTEIQNREKDRWGSKETDTGLQQPRRLIRTGRAVPEKQTRDPRIVNMFGSGGRSVFVQDEGQPPTAPAVGSGATLWYDTEVSVDSPWVDPNSSRSDADLGAPTTGPGLVHRLDVTEDFSAPSQTLVPKLSLRIKDDDGIEHTTDEVGAITGAYIEWTFTTIVISVEVILEVPGDVIRNLTSGKATYRMLYAPLEV